MNTNGISIVIPFFNRSKIAIETFESVMNQTDSRWECIVVDDGSEPDETTAVEQFCEKAPNFTFSKRATSNKGACSCRNEGWKKANFPYVIFLDSDDLLHADTVKNALEDFEQNEGIDASIYQCELFEKQAGDRAVLHNTLEGKDDLYRFITHDNPWMTSSGIWKVSFLETMGGWNEALPNSQDWDFHIRALAHSPKIIKSEKVAYYWRVVNQEPRISNLGHNTNTLLILADNFLNITQLLVKKELLSPEIQNALEAHAFWFCKILAGTSASAKSIVVWKQFWKIYPNNSSLRRKGLWKLRRHRIAAKGLNFFQRLNHDAFDQQTWPTQGPYNSKTRKTS